MNLHITDIRNWAGGTEQKVNVWVPSTAVVVHQLAAPKAPRRKWQELVPWMLEDRLLQPPEELHFVIADHNEQQLSILVTAKSSMQEWQESLAAAGVTNYSLFPDYLALPWQPDTVSLGAHGDRILVRYGKVQGFSVQPEFAWIMLENLLRQNQENAAAPELILYMPEQDLPEQFRQQVKSRQHSIDWQLAKAVEDADLLRGEFSLQRASGLPRAWMATAALVVLSVLLSYLSLSIDNQRLAEEVSSLSEQNRTDFYALFPGLSIRSGNIRTTVEDYIEDRFLQRDSLSGDVMQTLIALDEVLADCNCALQALNWTDTGLELQLPLGAAEIVDSWQAPGLQKQISADTDEGLTLILRRELAR